MKFNKSRALWWLFAVPRKGKTLLAAAALLILALAGSYAGFAGAGGAIPSLKGEMGDFNYFATPKPVPPIGFIGPKGQSLTLSDFKGKVVLVNFWATWCGPCVKEMPSLDRLQARLGGRDFTVVDISLDRQGREAVEPYFAQNNLTHLGIYLDPKSQAFRAWSGRGVPTSFLIGRDGKAYGVLLGPAEWDSPDALKLIQHVIDLGSSRAPDIQQTQTGAPGANG